MEVHPVFYIFLILPAIFGKPNIDQSNKLTQESEFSNNPNHGEWDHEDPRWNTKIPGRESFVTPVGPAAERSRQFWVNQGQNVLKQKINQNLKHKMKKAKNLVIFIGDGMGISTQMAARVYKGDVNSELEFEKFPFTGLAKTYCVNYQIPDSACTATAFLTGIKNNYQVKSNFILKSIGKITH